MLEILKVREEKPFESFEDLSTRIPAIKDPVKLLTKRVLIELDAEKTTRGKKKYSLFTKPAPQHKNRHNRRNKTQRN
jgi:putative nucleotide binding protein